MDTDAEMIHLTILPPPGLVGKFNQKREIIVTEVIFKEFARQCPGGDISREVMRSMSYGSPKYRYVEIHFSTFIGYLDGCSLWDSIEERFQLKN